MQQPSLTFARLPGFCCAAVFAAFGCANAAATESETARYPDLGFSGFGSLGLVHASIRSADFTSSILKESGAGRSQRWSPHVDSRLGAQLDLALNKHWSAVVQAVSEQRSNGSYQPVIEWANIKYQVTPDLSLRFGRIALPIFLAADYRKIGYAYTWVRPPVEMYNAVPLSNSDGVDASYRWSHGALKHVTQGFFGSTRKPLWDNATLKAHGIAGLSHTTSYRDASVRVSVLKADLSIDLARELFDNYRQFGAPGVSLAERYDVDHSRVYGMSAGLNYDPGNWFLIGELGRTRTSSYLGDTYTAYASTGYRLGDLTPYLSYAVIDPDGPIADPGISPRGLPPQPAYVATVLNGHLNHLLSTIAVQSTFTAGARWDFRPGLAVKVQYDRVRPTAGSRGSLISVGDDFVSGRTVHVASAVVDFVF